MTRLATFLVAFFAVVAIGSAGVVTMQARTLSGVRTELSTTQVALASTQADLRRAHAAALTAETDRKSQAEVLADERERAVAAEREVAKLKVLIARDRDTPRDAPTAPTLKDAIEGILKTGTTRQDAFFNGRRPDVWRLVTFRAGRVASIRVFKDEAACLDAAKVVAVENVGMPGAEGLRLRCEAARPGEAA